MRNSVSALRGAGRALTVSLWAERRRGLLGQHLGDAGRDRLLVDLLVVAGYRLAELVERAYERGLVPLDGALDLDDPVRHLLADEGGGACLQVVFEAHVLPGGRAENQAESRLTSPRIIRHALRGVNDPSLGLSSAQRATGSPGAARRPAARLRAPQGEVRPRRLVARRLALRGGRRRDPGPEHRGGERRAHSR